MQRRAVALGIALLITNLAISTPASAHYVQPPGEEEAAAAVVQVQVSYNYAVDLPGKGGEAGLFAATVAGPRGTGAVVSSSGAVLTGRSTAMPDRGEQQELVAVNQAFSTRYRLSWSEAQLAQRQRVTDEKVNSGLQACYANLTRCASFQRRTRTVVFNTKPARNLEGRYSEINDGLAIVSTRFDRARTPTVGISAAAPQPGGEYRALGWGRNRLLPPLAVTFENGAFRNSDLQKVAATFGNGGDGVVIVDTASKGDVVAVVVPGEDGKPTAVSPLKPLQFGGVDIDRGPLHPLVDQALGYFQGQHYAHALPLIQQVTRLIPDQGLLGKLQIARAKADGPEDKSMTASTPLASKESGSSWATAAALAAFAALAVAVAILWRRRRRGQLLDAEPDAEVDDFELDELIDEDSPMSRSGNDDPASQRTTGRLPSQQGQQLEAGPATATATTSQAESYCPQCGVTMQPGDRFCYHCGTPAR